MWNNQINKYDKIETDSEIQRTNQLLIVMRGWKEGQERGRGLTGMNY